MANKVIKCGATKLIDFGSQVKVIKGDAFDGSFLPMTLVKGLTIRQILALLDRVNADEKEFFRRAEILKATYPGVSFGYIGNVETCWDDRGYSIYLPHPGRVGTYADRVGMWARWELHKALASWATVEAAVAKGMVGR